MTADKVKVWFDAEADYLEVRFSDAAGYEKETKHDAVMERVNKDGQVIGFSILGVSRFKKTSRWKLTWLLREFPFPRCGTEAARLLFSSYEHCDGRSSAPSKRCRRSSSKNWRRGLPKSVSKLWMPPSRKPSERARSMRWQNVLFGMTPRPKNSALVFSEN
jgi:Zn ribbon nucleic-acid-binding protein